VAPPFRAALYDDRVLSIAALSSAALAPVKLVIARSMAAAIADVKYRLADITLSGG
jgi:hypothetical protein